MRVALMVSQWFKQAKSYRAPVVAGGLTVLLVACGRGEETAELRVASVEARQDLEQSRLRPPSVGLDSARLATAFDFAESLPRLRSLVVGRHGEIVRERSFRGPSLDTPVNVKSVSKSILSAAVGIAIADGHLGGVEQPIGAYFERYFSATEDPRKRSITLAHLLSMQSGLERTSGGNYGRWVSSSNWVRYAITRPMVEEPGGAMLYSTGNSHLLSAVLTEATGRNTWSYMRDRFARPLGIELPRWPADPQGIYFGGNDMRVSPRAMFRIGELYRNGGMHEGVQVVPEEWVRESLIPRTRSRWSGEQYGYGWFLSEIRGHRMFFAWGYGGQYIFVLPDLELTVVTTSDPDSPRERGHLQGIRALLTEHIVPGAELGARVSDGRVAEGADGWTELGTES